MKVAEKGSDRTAEVNVHVYGQVKAVTELGEYVDADDKAICCYIPLEEQQKIKLSCKFSGTTKTIWCDAVIDGIHRKATTYSAKNVVCLKNKKLDTETFMYQTGPKSFIDTDMLVNQIGAGVVATPGEMTETIGTMELRVYATRQSGVTYTPRGIDKYHSLSDRDDGKITEFKKIRPTLQMSFEQDSAVLDPIKSRREEQRVDDVRPGKGPWAIFRFHYRTPELIAEHKLKKSFDPSAKPKIDSECHILDLGPVPPLPFTAKKDEGDAGSAKTSSPAPPGSPLTPTKGDFIKPATSTSKITQPKLSFTSPTKMTLEQPKPVPESGKTATDREISRLAAPLTGRIDTEFSNKPNDAAIVKDGTAKVVVDAPVVSDTIELDLPKDKPATPTQNDIAQMCTSSMASRYTDTGPRRDTTVAVVVSSTGSRGASTPRKQPLNKSKPTKPPNNVGELKPTSTTTPPTTPTKRSAASADSTIPENKRTKVTPVPTPTTPTAASRFPSSSPMTSPRPLSTERELAELRKARAAMRQKRDATATKQAELDKKMKPYQQKMEEELEQLRLEMMEEAALAAEDEEHLKATEAMLAEVERAVGSN